jgi:hypothetical protein
MIEAMCVREQRLIINRATLEQCFSTGGSRVTPNPVVLYSFSNMYMGHQIVFKSVLWVTIDQTLRTTVLVDIKGGW